MSSTQANIGATATVVPLRPEGGSAVERIRLADIPVFNLGSLKVDPGQLKLVAGDRIERLQPRVMQVLVALARADGAIVTRDTLTESCWDGRIVGEDAITRVIVKLRRLAEGIGAGVFAIETVSKIGYRLDPLGAEGAVAPPEAKAEQGNGVAQRRWLLAALGALGIAGASGAWFWRSRPAAVSPDTEAGRAFAQGLDALRRYTSDADREAIGLLRRATALAPESSDSWGALALAYTYLYWNTDQGDASLELARAALKRSRQLGPDNGYAALAEIGVLPVRGEWLSWERSLRDITRAHAANDFAFNQLAYTLAQVGRFDEAVPPAARALQLAPTAPLNHLLFATVLWGANRLEESDAALGRALATFPGFPALWFRQFNNYLLSGRAAEAIEFAGRQDTRPSRSAAPAIEQSVAIARALAQGTREAAAGAMTQVMADARKSPSQCNYGMQYACAFGRVDEAFAAAQALYFARGFDPGGRLLGPDGRIVARFADRQTQPLFFPCTAPMRGDARFAALTRELGLERYWRESGSRPDYRKA